MGAGFTYTSSGDPSEKMAYTRPGKVFVGWVRSVPGGFGYRASETDSWTYGPKLKIDAAAALLVIHDDTLKST